MRTTLRMPVDHYLIAFVMVMTSYDQQLWKPEDGVRGKIEQEKEKIGVKSRVRNYSVALAAQSIINNNSVKLLV